MKAADTETMRELTTSTAPLVRVGEWEGNGAAFIRQAATVSATGVLTPAGRERMAQLLDAAGPAFDVEIDAIRTNGGRTYARTSSSVVGSLACSRWYSCAALLWAGTRRAVAVGSATTPGLLFLGGSDRQPSMLVGATSFTDDDFGYVEGAP